MPRKLPAQFKRERSSKYIAFTPTSADIKLAFERSQKLGIQRNSFTGGQGRMVGFLGEIAFELLFTNSVYVGDKSFTHD